MRKNSEDYRATRRQAVTKLTTELAYLLSTAQPDIAAYLIGSTATSDKHSPPDCDLLLINTAEPREKNTRSLQKLRLALGSSEPLTGSFDASENRLRLLINDAVERIIAQFPSLDIETSFAFGPAAAEFQCKKESLHIHIAGPLATGDLSLLRRLFPFHAADFLRFNKKICGPDLADLLSLQPALTSQELIEWDALNMMRFRAAKSLTAKKKWFRRIVRNRLYVSEGPKIDIEKLCEFSTVADEQELSSCLSDILHKTKESLR